MPYHAQSPSAGINRHLSHPKYRPDIDGLRAVAVLSVVIFHAFPSLMPGGFVGVDIFFVISGFLISTIIYGSLDRNGFSFSEFYARRIKRIFPALLLVLASCYVFGWYVLFADEFEQLGKHIAGGAGFIANILLWDESGYFDTAAEVKPLLHLWSLGIEEQFYIFWPVILWLAWKMKLNILWVAIAVALASFGLNITRISSDSSYVFYMPQTRIWELLIGSILAHVMMYRPTLIFQRRGIRNTLSIAGIGGIIYCFFAISGKASFPGWWALIPCLGAAMIIASGPEAWFNRYVLSSRSVVLIGLISFPFYLWHWPLLAFARIIEGEVPAAQVRVLAIAISAILAWATYKLLERPLGKSSSNLKTPVLLTLMFIVGASGFAAYLQSGLPERSNVKDAERFNSQFVGPLWKYTQNDICRNRYPFDEADEYGWWFCIANTDSSPDLLLLGNSHANHLFPGLAAEMATKDNSILSIGACPPDLPDVKDPNADKTTSPCSGDRPYRQKLLIDSIVEAGSISYAIIDGLQPALDSGSMSRLSERIAFLEKHGIQVIVFVPHIKVDRDLKSCFARPLKPRSSDCFVSIDAKIAIDNQFSSVINTISELHPGVKFFDQNELFCDEVKCSLIVKGMPIFRDHYDHYSEFASSEMAKFFIEWAKINEPGILRN